jgi:hypothetical protein
MEVDTRTEMDTVMDITIDMDIDFLVLTKVIFFKDLDI